MKPKDFQTKSAERIVALFNEGHNRLLLADEVGLGKTLVARTVVEKLKEQAKKDREPFRVIYVCSNQSIIHQNAQKLGIGKENIAKWSESRLSMQHKMMYKNKDKEEYLIPITPYTSIEPKNTYGNANERALIFLLIKDVIDDPDVVSILENYLDVRARGGNHTSVFTQLVQMEKDFPEGYCDFIHEKLKSNPDFKTIIEEMKRELCNSANPDKKYINQLRNLFSEISLEMLNPDLVIMDEFQRYRDLMKGGKNTEENRLAQKLFNADSNPKILLVSATPYKQMETLAEKYATGGNEDFQDLMQFLMDGNYKDFEEKWQKYSDRLFSLSNTNIGDFITAKKEVEESIRTVMVRTERYAPNLTNYQREIVYPTPEEINEYTLLRKALKEAEKEANKNKNRKDKKVKCPSLNIDYVKSSPYLLSFMQQYVEKDFIQENNPKIPGGLLVERKLLKAKKDIKCYNARLSALSKMLFSSKKHNDLKNTANLLWVPPSMPYYKTDGVFNACKDFSKILVFSQWGFVPRMLATVLSYEAGRFFSKKNSPKNALTKYKDLLLSPYPNLAELYKKGAPCEELKDVKERIKKEVIERLKSKGVKQFDDKASIHFKDILKILDGLNDDSPSALDFRINKKTVEIIINIIIASPGVCFYRCFKEDYSYKDDDKNNEKLKDFAVAFINMLGNSESQEIINKNFKKGRVFEKVIEYCLYGNLQAMIDEYAFVLGYPSARTVDDKKEIWEKMASSIIVHTTLEIDTDESFCKGEKKSSIRRWYACDYAKFKTDDEGEKRKISIQSAFNSPFRPFVLASTSVGQEGLDFHLYCRKVVHWNLPTNPVDLEQRSGRIDRYAGLAIRRSVAHLFPNVFNWNELFEHARTEWEREYPQQYNDLVPYWCLPKEVIAKNEKIIEKIENIFYLYPMSRDTEQYDKRQKQLSLYRLTLGQHDQEHLIDLLAKLDLQPNQKEELTINLAPKDAKSKS